MGQIVKGACWMTFRWYWLTSTAFAIFGECCGIFNCYFTSHLIKYLRDEDAPLEDGIKMAVAFSVIQITNTLCKNFYVHYGFLTSIRMRRTLVAVIFNKVTKLSMKSLIATNSGKLVSVISSDLFQAEKSLAFSPLIFSFPIVNIFAYCIIGVTSSWINSLIVFGVWIFMLVIQFSVGKLGRKIRFKYSACNDERLKLVNDMVVGIRTLKSYGWEKHYLKKITGVRNVQKCYNFLILAMQTLGYNLF